MKNTDILIILFFFFIILIVSFYGMYIIFKKATEIHQKLDSLKERSEKAFTTMELMKLSDELFHVQKESFHRSFVPKIVEIRTILKTKFDLLNNGHIKTSSDKIEY